MLTRKYIILVLFTALCACSSSKNATTATAAPASPTDSNTHTIQRKIKTSETPIQNAPKTLYDK